MSAKHYNVEILTQGLVIETTKGDCSVVQDLIIKVFLPTGTTKFIPFSLYNDCQLPDAAEKYWLLLKECQELLRNHETIYIGGVTITDMHTTDMHTEILYEALLKVQHITTVEKTKNTMTFGRWSILTTVQYQNTVTKGVDCLLSDYVNVLLLLKIPLQK